MPNTQSITWAFCNCSRSASIRLRLTPKSLWPVRDAERIWMRFVSVSRITLISSTKRKTRLVASAWSVSAVSWVITMRLWLLRASFNAFHASSGLSLILKGSIKCLASSAWLETQFGLSRQGGNFFFWSWICQICSAECHKNNIKKDFKCHKEWSIKILE